MMQKSIFLLALIGAAVALDVTNVNQLEEAKRGNLIVIKNIDVPAGTTLNLDKLKPGTTVRFVGVVTFGFKEWEGPLVRISGKNIKIEGAPGNLFDLKGERWWDTKGGNGGRKKPKFASLKLADSSITGLKVKNLPVHGFSINGCNNLVIDNVKIDTREGEAKGGHNTDGFDIGRSDNIKITNCEVWNQDDCLAINSGRNIIFENNVCKGGHGVSIGSVGGRDDNVVKNVLVKKVVVQDSDNGVRIKTVKDAKGLVEDITFEDVVLKNIGKTGIVIQGNYLNSGPRGDPTPGVPIRNLTLKNVKGNVSKSGTNVYVFVADASNWKWDVDVRGGMKKKECRGIPKEVAGAISKML